MALVVLHAALASAANEAVLPPDRPWSGQSQALALPPEDPWATPAEKERLLRTPRYDETIAWLRALVDKAPELHMLSIGRSPEGRDIWMVVASREKATTPEALKASGKPTLLAHSGIHAGEIDGKDAGMMLLRDMTVRGTRRELLDHANWLFIPILNVDGHERFSDHARINQRGPVESGWRTTSRNLNLNRDFAKLDAPETRAVVGVLDRWDPDFYADLHVTDGLDHQYDITFGGQGASGWSPALEVVLEGLVRPALEKDLVAMGHTPGPLWVAFANNVSDLSQGFTEPIPGARFSTGYGAARHIPTLLLENHSLKPYPRRVLGTYVFLESLLRLLGEQAKTIRAAITYDRRLRAETFAVGFAAQSADIPRLEVRYLGVESHLADSPVSGGKRVVWTERPATLRVPLTRYEVAATTRRPRAYWVPPAWSEVIERLSLHGLRMERLEAPREVEVEMWRIKDPKLSPEPFEGHVTVTGSFETERRRERYPAGSVRVPTDQPLGDLAVVLLDPTSPDSFFQWGFFLEVLQATEYVEGYVMDPTAERLLAADPALRKEYEQRLKDDPAFAAKPDERLLWLYRRTPFADERWRLYPVGREE
jgi:murein tripeptide amidase MpaA